MEEPEPAIYREEVVALLFNVSNIVALLGRMLEEDDGEAEDEG